MKTCRYCHKQEYGQAEDAMIRFGKRHHAHPACFLDHRDVLELTPRQVAQLPYSLLRDRGLLTWADSYCKEYLANTAGTQAGR